MSLIPFVEVERHEFGPEPMHRKIEIVIAAGCGKETAPMFKVSSQAVALIRDSKSYSPELSTMQIYNFRIPIFILNFGFRIRNQCHQLSTK